MQESRQAAARTGVYICECGPNLKEALHIEDLVAAAERLEGVVLARPWGVLCSEEGGDLIRKDIARHGLDRIVVAGCTPREHEETFRKFLVQAGLNPFLLQIANIREQCAWVCRDRARATEKARILIQAAVARVALHEPLEAREVEVNPDVLVVGAGVTGMTAALTLARSRRKVTLVEKDPCIGGRVTRYDKVFPGNECASCMLDPVMDEVLHHDDIEVIPLGHIEEVRGYFGNFHVVVKETARGVDLDSCLSCGACLAVCPVRVPDPYNEALDDHGAIHIPYPGALPGAAVIDRNHCLHGRGEPCGACTDVCPFGSIRLDEEDRMRDLEVGSILLATGFDLIDPTTVSGTGYGGIPGVYTCLELERMLNPDGPTGGRIVLKSGRTPAKVTLVHCVGFHSGALEGRCSTVCCRLSLKYVDQIRSQLPDVSLVVLHSDLCLPGTSAAALQKSVDGGEGIEMVRVRRPGEVETEACEGGIAVRYVGVDGEPDRFHTDMVVLLCGLEGSRGTLDLAHKLNLPVGPDRLFRNACTALSPLSTVIEGVTVAGCARTPMDIETSILDGQAAAGVILSRLTPGSRVDIEARTSYVDGDLCSGCRTCIGVCPFNALEYSEEDGVVSVNELLCRGCGTCFAACPSGAITCRHYTSEQLGRELEGVLDG